MNQRIESKKNISAKKFDRKLLWLGSYQSQEMFERMPARVFGEASGYTSQKGLVQGIDALLDDSSEMDTIACSIAFPDFPEYPNLYVPREIWSRTGASYDTVIRYLNVKYLKYLSRDRALSHEVKSWAKEKRGVKENTVIVYEPSVSKLRAALYLKDHIGASVYVVIPDVSELVSLGSNKLKKLAKSYAARKIRQLFRRVDGFILYSEPMASYYNIPKEKWICVEGVFDPGEVRAMESQKQNDTVVRLTYCGALDQYRGVPQLLDAFDKLREQNYELWLTGAGPSEKLIRERMKSDPRIKLLGYLKTREEVLTLENESDVLIHMRDIHSPAAPYCFPSKLFEYLVTGKPVVSVDIPSIPREYFNYLIKIEDMSVESINTAITKAVGMSPDEREALGRAGREFVLQNKVSWKQAENILQFISSRP